MATTEPAGPAARRGSQSRVSPVLLLILAAAVLFRIVTAVTDREEDPTTLVRWMASPAAQAVSQRRKLPILYDFTAAWCAPCKILDREGWNDPQIAALVHGRYVPVRVVDRQREEGRNLPEVAALQRKHAVRAFPTLVVVAPDGREVAKQEGYRGRAALQQFLTDSAAAALSPPPAR